MAASPLWSARSGGWHGAGAPAPARRRGGRDGGPAAPALAQGRGRSARVALGRAHPLADRLRAVRALAP